MYHAIKSIHPDIRDDQFTLRDDGDGPYIERRDYDGPRPRKKTIEAASRKLMGREDDI